ncbi:MAG: entry exclusion 1 domain-containing protein [Alphaproteobacteria bacterium]|nr:MAG: entry exclusion 1 domain-containing protein [Alphaproteobacteria bacterium]
MAKVGVQRATELTGKSKSTIQRAMKSGKLSYDVENNRKLIDVSELERVYGVSELSTQAAPKAVESSFEAELQKARHALEVDRLELTVKTLQDQLDVAQDQVNDLKAQRDQWQKQAQQVLLTSQHSQQQSDDRIAEMRAREEARAKAMHAKRQQELQRQKRIAASNQNGRNNSLFSALFTKKKKAS